MTKIKAAPCLARGGLFERFADLFQLLDLKAGLQQVVEKLDAFQQPAMRLLENLWFSVQSQISRK
jgi:hypothetical protein